MMIYSNYLSDTEIFQGTTDSKVAARALFALSVHVPVFHAKRLNTLKIGRFDLNKFSCSVTVISKTKQIASCIFGGIEDLPFQFLIIKRLLYRLAQTQLNKNCSHKNCCPPLFPLQMQLYPFSESMSYTPVKERFPLQTSLISFYQSLINMEGIIFPDASVINPVEPFFSEISNRCNSIPAPGEIIVDQYAVRISQPDL